jgi:tetratricopeptide (TPR) repeat protein
VNAIKKSIELFEKGSYKKALKMFNSILNDNPLDDLIWRYKGEALAKLGNFKEAIACYDKAIEILPEYMTEEMWMLKGKALSQCSEFDNAIECFNQILKINPASEVAVKEKQVVKKLKEKATKNAMKEIDALTKQVNAAFELNRVLRNVGIQSDHLQKTLYNAMSNENFKEKMLEDLLEYAQEYRQDKPVEEDAAVWYEKGLVSLRSNEYANAILYLDKCLETNLKNSDVWCSIANAYFSLKRDEYAQFCLERSLQLNPENTEALYLKKRIKSSNFFPDLFFFLKNPIKGVKVEGNNLREICTRALRIFRPYLILNNSELKIVDIKNKIVHVGLIGDLNEPFGPPNPIYADIESFLRTIDPTLNMVVVKFM